VRLLICDRDSTYTGPLHEVFSSGAIRIAKTPVRAPQANAIAERFVRTIRAECLDWLLILNRRHLEHVLRVDVEHNTQRAHRALKLQPPQRAQPPPTPPIGEIDRLGGLIHEYYRAADWGATRLLALVQALDVGDGVLLEHADLDAVAVEARQARQAPSDARQRVDFAERCGRSASRRAHSAMS
jgi:hypothetical protein